MKRKKIKSITILLILFSNLLTAQKRPTEYSIEKKSLIILSGAGILFGDIGGGTAAKSFLGLDGFGFSQANLTTSIGFRSVFENRWGYRIWVQGSYMYNSDSGTKNDKRGYSFATDLMEIGGQAEYTLLHGRINYLVNYSVYSYLGFGLAYTNPAFFGKKKKLFDKFLIRNMASHFIPAGGGADISFMNGISIGAEIGFQYGFSDFWDGVSTENSKYNDMATTFLISLSYNFKRKKKSCNCNDW